MPAENDSLDPYRLLIIRREAAEILLSSNGQAWRLPRVEIPKHRRVAQQLTEAVHKRLGLKVYCLLAPAITASGSTTGLSSAVLESVRQNEKAPDGNCWMPISVVTHCTDSGEAKAIREALADLASYTSGEKFGPFAKPGWLRELFQWTFEQTAPLGLRLTGNFRQYNASPAFSLLRLETDAGAVWFKATGEPNAHELPVTLLLASLFPNHVPRVLGVHPSWNGWLTAEAEGTPLEDLTESPAWERAAEGLAGLQIESVGKAAELVDGRCKDLRLPPAARHIDHFVTRMGEFMRAQVKQSPAPLMGTELLSLGEGLKYAFSLLQGFGFPDTLGHLDCNPGNLVVSPERCVFLDWAEACVTNPLITFEYLRRHMERCRIDEPAVESRITAAYLRPWASFFSPHDLRRAIAAVPPVAVFIHAIAGDAWRTVNPVSNPALASYYRSLTRRMHRDVFNATERSESCVH
jgi:hypothetical protein